MFPPFSYLASESFAMAELHKFTDVILFHHLFSWFDFASLLIICNKQLFS